MYKMHPLTCEVCGVRYQGKPKSRFCSRVCTGISRRREGRICAPCGSEFQPINATQKHCSHRCHMLARTQRWHATGVYPEQVEITCEQCGVSFSVEPSLALNKSNGSKKRFCSNKCRATAVGESHRLHGANLIDYTCQECGRQWRDKPSLRHRKKYCSRECVGAATVRRNAALSPSSIETETYAALAELAIPFSPQYRIGRWVTDVFISSLNLVIECQGDFYHCNPAVFPDGPKSVIQQRGIERDKQKFADLRGKGYHVLALWEKDIREKGAVALLQCLLPPTSATPA